MSIKERTVKVFTCDHSHCKVESEKEMDKCFSCGNHVCKNHVNLLSVRLTFKPGTSKVYTMMQMWPNYEGDPKITLCDACTSRLVNQKTMTAISRAIQELIWDKFNPEEKD